MASDDRRLVILNDNLQAPPRASEHIHLLSLARSAAHYLPTRVFSWVRAVDDPALAEWRGPAGAEPLLAPLVSGTSAPGSLTRTRRYIAHAWQWIDANAPPGSVIWVRRHPTALFLLPRLLDRRARARFRFVYDASSFLRLECDAGGRGRPTLLKAMFEERLWRRFDLIRTLSDPMKDYLVRQGIPAERVLVIPVGVPAPAQHWQASPTPRRVLYVGSDSAWQGLRNLLEAMQILARTAPEIRLTVVGVTPETLGPAAGADNVDCLGYVPHAQVAEFYLDHDLFVLPRPRVPLTEMVVPIKIVEALAAGLPLLATDLAAVRWVTGDAGALFVDDNRPATLAVGMRAALADPAALARVSTAGLVRAEQFFWPRIGAEIKAQLFSTD